ncbi:hypothetical protein N2152v2_010990 [Parachlorella kessleri]
MARGGLPPPLTHVYAEPEATAFSPHPHQQLFFDEAAACLHVLLGYTITTVRLPTDSPHRQNGRLASPGDVQAVLSEAAGHAPLSAPGISHYLSAGTAAASRTEGAALPCISFSVSAGAPVLLVRAQLLPAIGLSWQQPSAAGSPRRSDGEPLAAGSTAAAYAVLTDAGSITAVQRSGRLIEFVDPSSGNIFLESPSDRHGQAVSLLRGFFWTASPRSLFVMVTNQGLEMYSLKPGGQGLKMEGTQRLHDVRWYHYCHRSRLAVVGCGEAGTKLQAFQFTSAAAIKLPPLDLASPPAAIPKASAPAGAAVVGSGAAGTAHARPPAVQGLLQLGGRGRGRGGSKPSAGPDCVWVVTLYGRVYLCHLDKGARVLRLYRMYRDVIMLFHAYEVFSDAVTLSEIDSVLLVHDVHSGVVLLLDVLTGNPTPLCAPLPLGLPRGVGDPLLGSPAANSGSLPPAAPVPVAGHLHAVHAARAVQHAAELPLPGQHAAASRHGTAAASARTVAAAAAAAAVSPLRGGTLPDARTSSQEQAQHAQQRPALMLCPPRWLVDPGTGVLCSLKLDLPAVVETCSDWPTLVAFLQRRAAGGGAGDTASPLALTLQVTKNILQERTPLPTMALVFQAINVAYRDALRLIGEAEGVAAAAGAGAATAAQEPAPSLDDYPVVSPEAMAGRVFGWLREEQVVDSQYLQAALAQYLASCHSLGIHLPPSLGVLSVEVLLDLGRGHLVGPLLSSQLILDSGDVAEHLEGLAQQGRLPQGRALAQDMCCRLGDYDTLCALLLREAASAGPLPSRRSEGAGAAALLRALRIVQAHKIDSIPPQAFLEAAAKARDPILFAAVYRFCRDRVKPFLPGFAEVRGQYDQWLATASQQ